MKKNILLFVNSVSKGTLASVREYEKTVGKKFRIGVIRDKQKSDWSEQTKQRGISFLVVSNFKKTGLVKKSLMPYIQDIVAVISRSESNIDTFKKIIPHVPYVLAPTESSLTWATDKIQMREQFTAFDSDISPKFTVITDDTKKSIEKVSKKVGFPLVIKPAGLAASLLVSICFHEEELEKTVKKVFRKIRKVYKDNNREEVPRVLVEQFMEGEMYSVDAYVNAKGTISWCPMVHVKTGRTIGFDDFFGYQRITPTTLKQSTQDKALIVAAKSVHALGLKNSTAHIELMRTDSGWKVIELGARIGGFRNTLYNLSFGIKHDLNDILIRLGEKPKLPKKQKGFAVAMQFFAKKEGVLHTLKGLKKIQKLESFQEIKKHLQIGDMCLFAKHGGKSICDIILFNKNRSELLADIRRIEEYMVIETSKK